MQFRITMIHLSAIVAVVAAGFVPLNNLTRLWLGVLMYIKFSIVIGSAFLALYGKNHDRWLGFAIFGAAYTLFCVPGLWCASRTVCADRFDCFDLLGAAR